MSSTHFGYQTVDEREKARRVRGVFDSVAPRYDLMNDLMSFGLHRAWKAYTVMVANVRPGQQVLDIAGGTGDLARAFARKVGPTGGVVHTDINETMLRNGRDRLLAGLLLGGRVVGRRLLRGARRPARARPRRDRRPRLRAGAACWAAWPPAWAWPGWRMRWAWARPSASS